MPPRTGYPRPSGTDGSDGKFRMVIEDRYKVLAQNRKSMQSFLYGIVALGLFRIIWHVIPYFIDGSRPHVSAMVSTAVIFLSAILYLTGSGGSTPHKEKLPLLNLHAVLNMLALSVMAYSAYVCHFATPLDLRIPQKVAAYTAAKTGTDGAAHIIVLGRVLEYTLDASLGLLLLASAAVTWSYISLKTSATSTKKSK